MFDDRDQQIERERKWTGYMIAAVFGGGILALLACSVGIVLLSIATGESSPRQAREWFKTVVAVDPSPFTSIQHYTDQGIDFSHHFRFRFSDLVAVQKVVETHELTPAPNARAMYMDHLPDWYVPFNAPADALRFRRGGSDPMLLVVDTNARIAYIETAHL